VDVGVQAGAGVGAGDLLAAEDVGEHPVQGVHRSADRARIAEWAEVLGAVGRDAPRDLDSRPILLHRDADVRIMLVVSKHDVVLGPLRLDEVGLPLEGLERGSGEDVLDVRDLGHEGDDFAAARVGRLEVGADSRPKRRRLTNVDGLPLGILELIDAGLSWKVPDLLGQRFVRELHSCLRALETQNYCTGVPAGWVMLEPETRCAMRAVTVGIVLAAVVGAASSLLFGARLAHAPEDSGGARNPLTAVGRQPEVVQAPTSALWVDLAQQRVPRQEMAVAELGGRIYAIGGFNPDGSSANTVEAYDPATDSWATVAPLPIALNHPAAATVGDHVYVIGGHPDQGAEAVDTVYAYDAGADRWVPRARMPTARGALAVAVADGKIYAMGGSPDRRERDFAVYDPDADAWTPLPAMPTPRNHLAAGALNGKIYAVGGRS